MRINPFFLPLLLIVSVLGSIALAQATGNWTTSGRTAIDPATLKASDLKGWMTLQQVMDGLGINQTDLYAAAGVAADMPPATALKDLEAIVPGFSITTLREKLAARALAPTAATPAPAATVPTPVATPSAEHSGTGSGPTPLPPGQALAAKNIKGRMTLDDVASQCAVPLSALLIGLNLPAGTDPATAIKDLITQGRLTDVTDVQKVVESLQQK